MSVEKTQEILERIIKQPQLTEKLLSRPPFKFILDIVINVIAATGYLKDEISDSEIQRANSDKDTKRDFLEKLINILDDGSLKRIKATEIIGGRDSGGANKMLQKLGTNASNFSKNGGGEEVKKKKKSKKEQIKNENGGAEEFSSKKRSSRKDGNSGNKFKEQNSTEKAEKIEKTKSKHSPEKSVKKSSTSKDRHQSREKKKTSSNDKIRDKSSEKSSLKKSKKSTEDSDNPKKIYKKNPSERHLKRQDSMIAVNGDAPDTPNNDNESTTEDSYEDQEKNVNNRKVDEEISKKRNSIQSEVSQLNNAVVSKLEEQMHPVSYASEFVRPMTGATGGRPMTSMGRPGTAASRPAPPKLKKKQIATINETPPLVIELQSYIIKDASPDIITDNENNFIIENNEDDEEKTARISEVVNEEDRGALVQKILETKAGIEDSATLDNEKNLGSDKVSSMENEKVKQLQEKLQDLTKSAYPLARLFDFASDDIESMIKELERWRADQKKNEQEEQNKQSSGFGDSNRLYNVIGNLQKEIDDLKEELSKARGRVLHNQNRMALFINNI